MDGHWMRLIIRDGQICMDLHCIFSRLDIQKLLWNPGTTIIHSKMTSPSIRWFLSALPGAASPLSLIAIRPAENICVCLALDAKFWLWPSKFSEPCDLEEEGGMFDMAGLW